MDPNEQKERMEEILLTATNERKKIQEVKLPGEPDYKAGRLRIGSDFDDAVGGILGKFKDDIAKVEEKEKQIKEDPKADTTHLPPPVPPHKLPSNWEA